MVLEKLLERCRWTLFICRPCGVYEPSRKQSWKKYYGHSQARSTSHGENSRELCTASYDSRRSAFRSHHDSTAGARWAWTAKSPEELRTPAVSMRRSVQQDYVVCLDCGYRGKPLRRHINRQHGLSRDEYRERWGLRNDHQLTAPAYTERRSMLAKELGLGRKPKEQGDPAVSPTAPPKAGRRGSGTRGNADTHTEIRFGNFSQNCFLKGSYTPDANQLKESSAASLR